MKFSELPLGAEFVFEGERYAKVSPLMAHHVVTGASRLIHRSASISEIGAQRSLPTRPETVASAQVIAGLDELCRQMTAALEELGGDADDVHARLGELRRDFLRSLKLTD